MNDNTTLSNPVVLPGYQEFVEHRLGPYQHHLPTTNMKLNYVLQQRMLLLVQKHICQSLVQRTKECK